MLSNSRRAALWISTSKLPPVTFPTSSAALCQTCLSDRRITYAVLSHLQCCSVDHICFKDVYILVGQLIYEVAEERGLVRVADSDEHRVVLILRLWVW